MHYELANLEWSPLGDTGWRQATVTLGRGDSAPNPASTKSDIFGPAVVTYREAPDGGFDVIVNRPSPKVAPGW